MARIPVIKTYKLYVNGSFPRSESGRTIEIPDDDGNTLAHICRGSRKDLRDAVEAAQKARAGWAKRTAYNRGQIIYRMAEMLEGKSDEFIDAIRATTGDTAATARRQVEAAVDRLVAFAGWADKYAQVLGCNNPVAGPYYNFTIPEPTGVIVIVPPDTPPLLSLVSLLAPVICSGNTTIVVANHTHPIPAAIFGEVCATSDVPAGVINIITADRNELIDHIADHRGIDGISTANLSKKHATRLREGVADNLKRVHVDTIKDDAWHDPDSRESPWTIEPFVEMKTIWHPSGT